MNRKKVLLGEQDQDFSDAVTDILTCEGFVVEKETDWDSIYPKILNNSNSVAVLNTALPGMSIFSVLKEIRASYAGFIILLSDQDNAVDQILAYELGADDFIVKPVHLRLLTARMHSLLRRNEPFKTSNPKKTVSVGNLTVDAARREVYLDGHAVDLTTILFDLLWFLISHAGNVVSRDELCKAVRSTDYNGIDRSIDVYISRLRQKLGDDPSNPCFLKTVRGTGYLFAGKIDG